MNVVRRGLGWKFVGDWAGTGDGMSRSYGDRWNTEGGRWTEERHRAENQEYVPKNQRWNDEGTLGSLFVLPS